MHGCYICDHEHISVNSWRWDRKKWSWSVIGCGRSISAQLSTTVKHVNCEGSLSTDVATRRQVFPLYPTNFLGVSGQQRVRGAVRCLHIFVLRELSRYLECHVTRTAFEKCVRRNKSRSSVVGFYVSVKNERINIGCSIEMKVDVLL
jgi:hypothetical protein